jgi:hypothetical protein
MVFPAWLAVIEHDPAATNVREVPLTVQIVGVVEAKLIVRPLVEVATNVYGDWARVKVVAGEKVIVWVALVMVIERVTFGAGEYVAFPAWFAVRVQVPVTRRVKTFPETVHTVVVLEVRVTVKPLLAVAVNVYGDCARVKAEGGANVIF